MSFHQSVASVLLAVDRTLEIARQGWQTYKKGGEARYAGLLNAITATRSVTNVIQNLRGKADGFDEWWSEEVRSLDNPIARWFVEVRNRIEKQGTLGDSTTVMTFNFDSGDLAEMQRNAPAGTTDMFLGDSLGRNGWVVTLPDGSQQTVYFSLPATIVDPYFEIADAPGGRRIDDLFPIWFEQIEHLALAAHKRFEQA